MWARMNRCSCIYDMQYTFLKLSPIEKEMLSWLEKEVRPKLHATAQFDGKVDTPIKRDAYVFVNGNCLWNEFVTGNPRKLPTEDDEDAIVKHVRRFDMTEAAQYDRTMLPYEIRMKLRSHSRIWERSRYELSGASDEEEADSSDVEEAKSPSNLKVSSPSNQDDSKWDIGKTVLQYRIVTETAERYLFG